MPTTLTLPQPVSAHNTALPYPLEVDRPQALPDVINQLTRQHRFIALRGDQSVGKSHFLQQKVIPHYRGQGWRVAYLRPGVDPLESLAHSLAEPGVLLDAQAADPHLGNQLVRRFRQGKSGALVSVYREYLGQSATDNRLLIVVDQLEQLFQLQNHLRSPSPIRFAGRPAVNPHRENSSFFNLLRATLAADVPVYLILAIGPQSVDTLNAQPGWPELLGLHRYALNAIEPVRLEEALLPREGLAEAQEPTRELRHTIVQDYKKRFSSDPAALARVNAALRLLTAGPGRDLALSIAKPTNTSVVLTNGSSDAATNILGYYRDFGGLDGAPNELCTRVYRQLTEEDQRITELLFRALSTKDPSSERIANNYPVSVGYLLRVCFRTAQVLPDGSTPDREVNGGEPLSEEVYHRRSVALRRVLTLWHDLGPGLRPLIDWVGAPRRAGGEHSFTNQTIVQLVDTPLLQSWELLNQWVNQEYAASNIYRKLVEDAKLHYATNFANTAVGTGSAGPTNPTIPPRPPLWREFYNSLIGVYESLGGRGGKDDSATTGNAGRTLLSEGGVELVEQWLHDNQPNQDWGLKYRSDYVLDEDERKGRGFAGWLDTQKLGSFDLVLRYWRESRAYHRRVATNERLRIRQEINSQRRIARVATGAFAIALVLGVWSLLLKLEADETRNNLDLLGYVDTLVKTGLIPTNIYRSEEFNDLKLSIEEDGDIDSRSIVVDSLAAWQILNFPGSSTASEYGQIAKRALLQLPILVDNFHGDDPQELVAVTQELLAIGHEAEDYNELHPDYNYQFPYVYLSLLEARTALDNAVTTGAATNTGVGAYTASYEADDIIIDMEANPGVPDQYAVALMDGGIRLLWANGEVYERIEPTAGGISSIDYSQDGSALFISNWNGSLYVYEGLRDEANPLAPRGRTEALAPTELDINWGRLDGQIALVEVNTTSRPDYLIVYTDFSMLLLQRTGPHRYRVAQNYDVVADVNTQTGIWDAPGGEYFIYQGTEATAIYRFDPDRARIERVAFLSTNGEDFADLAFRTVPGTPIENQLIAILLMNGDLMLTTLKEQLAAEGLNEYRTVTSDASTGLRFNTGKLADQIISAGPQSELTMTTFSLDEATGMPVTYDYDNLQLGINTFTGLSVALREDYLITTESNYLITWPTNLTALRRIVEDRLKEYAEANKLPLDE